MNSSEPNSIDNKETEQDATLAELLQKITGSGIFSDSSSASGSSQPSRSSQNGDLISSLLSNPEMISKLPQMISVLKPIIENLGERQINNKSHTETEPTSEQGVQISNKNGSDSRSALLCALKPYLSRDRQNAIDYIIKLSKLGDILKTL